MHNVSINQKKAIASILILDMLYFKTKDITKDRGTFHHDSAKPCRKESQHFDT